MSQPPTYTRQSDFSDHSTSQPTTPHVGVDLDSEYNAIKTTLDVVLSNIALLQRDDGEQANRTIGKVQLKEGIVIGVEPATDWLTATAYETNNLVWIGGSLYLANEDHTSGVFATDLTAGKWGLIFDLGAEVPVATGIFINTVEDQAAGTKVLAETDNGRAFTADTSGGNVTFTLPEISTLVNGNFYRVLVFKDSAGNSMNVNPSGADTINGEASNTFAAQYSSTLYYCQVGSTDWKQLDFSPASAVAAANPATAIAYHSTLTC